MDSKNLQPTCNLASNDCISRQAAIDALWKALYKYEDKTEKQFQNSDELDVGDWFMHRIFVQNMSDIDRQAILDLPSAQPETCEDAVSRNAIIQKLNTMDRYVSEELVLCDTDKKFPKNEVFIVDDVYEEIVENLPSAQPDLSGYSDRLWKAAYERGKAEAQADIIHCGECKYYHDSDGCFFSTATTGANGFCHWAERKEGE